MSSSPPLAAAAGRSPSWFTRTGAILHWLFVDGPAPSDLTRPLEMSRWETLLTWPIRLLLVAGTALVAWIWASTSVGVQFGWALQYGLLVAISIVTSFWFWILIVNTGLAVLWVVLSWNAVSAPQNAEGEITWGPLDVVTWLNRQIGHVEALAAWIAVSFVVSHLLLVQATMLAAVIFLGGPIINGIARTRWFGGEQARRSRAALLMDRRSVIYLASAAGLVVLAAQAPKQLPAIFPLLVTVLPGLALRYFRFRRRKRQEKNDAGAGVEGGVRVQRLKRAELQHKAARIGDTAVAAIVILTFFGLTAGLSVWERHKIAVGARSEDDGPPPPDDRCAPEPGGPVVPTLAMFLLADTQMHELGGRPFPGQMEVADALVPVARRPVELDMLSTAAVVRYQTVYRDLIAERARDPRKLAPPLWAHLGDFADLSCVGEMKRMLELLDDYAPGTRTLAGIAPGNHDMSFQGNFAWSPFWDTACAQNMDKTDSDAAVGEMLGRRLVSPEGKTERLRHWKPSAPFGLVPASRFTVSRVGVVPATSGGSAHGVMAVFLDSADQEARDFGVAGTFGTFSESQREAVEAAVAAARAARPKPDPGVDPYADPWFVLFAHHPYAELTSSSREELDKLITTLDGGARDCSVTDGDCEGPRVLALITAHTHTAESHRHCVAQRLVREIVVGSVIDPPEQASWLEIGADAHGHGSLRLSTLPTVARAGFMCTTAHTIDAGACRRAMGVLSAAPACQTFIAAEGTGGESADSCETLERPLSVSEQVDGIVRHGGPNDVAEVKKSERRRALALLDCVCRELPNHPAPPECLVLRDAKLREAPLRDEAYAPIVRVLAEDPARQEELTCLAWAAADLQQHKATGMTMPDAIRCAFDDPTLPPAQVTVASREDVPCH